MKRFLVIMMGLIFIISNSYAGDPLDLQTLTNKLKAEAEKQIEPVIDVLSTCLNSGIYAPVSGKVFSIGLQVNGSQLKKEGILKDVKIPAIAIPFAYAGVRIPVFGINLFLRGLVFPVPESETLAKIIGLGGGWEPRFIPMISIKLIIQYHYLKDFPFIDANSMGGTIFAALSAVPFITPFTFIGLNNTSITTPGIRISGEIMDFSFSKNNFQFGIGLKLIKILTIEANFLPSLAGSLSLGFSF